MPQFGSMTSIRRGVAVLLLASAPASCSEAGDYSRTWTTEDGRRATAVLVEWTDTSVTLRDAKNRTFTWRFDTLSKKDQIYVKRKMAAQAAAISNDEKRLMLEMLYPGQTGTRVSPTKPVTAEDVKKACDSIAKQIVETYRRPDGVLGPLPMAVLSFAEVSGQSSDLGWKLAEDLITKLFVVDVDGTFAMKERQPVVLQKILQEHQIQSDGLLDPDSAKELGKLLGISAVVTGTVSATASPPRLNARLISVETGQILAVAASPLGSDKSQIASAATDLCKQIKETYRRKKVKAAKAEKIAIIEFTDKSSRSSNLGTLLSEELVSRLFQMKDFQLIERQLLEKVLEEHKLGAEGLLDPATMKELGRLLAVEGILVGTSYAEGDTVEVNARLISTEDGTLQAVASVALRQDTEVATLLAEHRTNNRAAEKATAPHFFFEDFSTVEKGEFPANWTVGKTLLVNSKKGANGKETRFLTNFTAADHHKALIGDIEFPSDFAFEWLLFPSDEEAKYTTTDYRMAIGNVAVTLRVDGAHRGSWIEISDGERPSRQDIDWQSVFAQNVRVRLEKRSNVFVVILDAKECLRARYENFKKARGAVFEVKPSKGADKVFFRLLSVAGYAF